MTPDRSCGASQDDVRQDQVMQTAGSIGPSSSEPSVDFATRLRAAISESGLSLTQIVRRVQERGLTITAASLSTWQNGITTPTRQASVPVLREIERILGLDKGELLRLTPLWERHTELPEEARREPEELRAWGRQVAESWGIDRTDAIGCDLMVFRVFIESDGTRNYTLELVLRARLDGADRLICLVQRPPGQSGGLMPPARPLAGCRTGRQADAIINGRPSKLVEVLLPRPLRVGEQWRIELANAHPDACDDPFHLVLPQLASRTNVIHLVFRDGPRPVSVTELPEDEVVSAIGAAEQDEVRTVRGSVTVTTGQDSPGRPVMVRWSSPD